MTTRSRKAQPVTVEKLLEDMQLVVRDAEELLKATAGQAGERVQQARARAEESLSAARERLAQLRDNALDQASELVASGEEYVQRNPWRAVGMAAGAGLLAGLLINLGRR